MKKVLIIANLYHASPRIPNLVKYLESFNWKATILTPPVNKDFLINNCGKNLRIIETQKYNDVFSFWRKVLEKKGFKTEGNLLNQVKEKAGSDFKKAIIDFIFKTCRTIFAYPDEEKKWRKVAIKAGKNLLENEKFNVVVSSSSPVTAHIVAERLKSKYNIPWVADFRDLWTQNHNYSYCFLRKKIEKRLEKKIISDADALITVSLPLANKLKELHKGKKTYAILNSFKIEEVNFPPVRLARKFIITYTGQIYKGKQNSFKLLTAIKQLISEDKIDATNIKLRFYGPEREWLDREIEELGLLDIVKQEGMVSRQESLKKQRESQLLLLLKWEDSKEKGVYTGKIFEYLAARRPILAVGGSKDVVSELLNRTNVGADVLNIEEIKKALESFYSEYKRNNKVLFKGRLDVIDNYNAKQMTRKFVNILDKIS